MSDRHLTQEDLDGLMAGDAAAVRRFFEHALHDGCEFCRRRAAPVLQGFADEVPQEDEGGTPDPRYDLRIKRALRGVKRYAGKFRKELSRVAEGRAARAKNPSPRFWPSKANTLRGWSQIQVKLEEAFAFRYRDPEYMLARMDLIVFEVEQLDARDYPPAMVADFKARVYAERANAHRLQDDFRAAGRDFRKAQELLEQGTGDILAAARVCQLIASLRKDERRFRDADAFLNVAERLYREAGEDHLAGRAMITRGIHRSYEGDHAASLALLEEGESLLDPESDPELAATTRQNRIQALVECGRPREAAELLLQSGLREAFRDDPLNLARLRGTEGCLYAALGQYGKAEAAFEDERRVFIERGLPFMTAIASLDLSGVWLAQGKFTRVLETAEILRDIFEDLGIYREAIIATGFLAEALREGTFPASFALGHVRQFFGQIEREPAARFTRPRRP